VLLWLRGIFAPQPMLLRRAATLLAASLAMAASLRAGLWLVAPLLAPSYGFATRFSMLIGLCAMGGAVFLALVLAFGAVDAPLLRRLLRRGPAPAAAAGRTSDGFERPGLAARLGLMPKR
jgi:putative peptidoglycan lipid II flippase